MRILRHSLLLPAILAIGLPLVAAGQARAAQVRAMDSASVVSQVEAANLPSTTANPTAAPASAGADISAPEPADTTDTSSVDNVQSTVQTTSQSDAPGGPPAPAAPTAPAVPTPPAVPVPPAPPAPPPTPPAAPETPTPVPASNTTSQVISQVQISGCLSHCQGGNQTQVASQQNQTVQTLGSAPPRAPTSTPTSTPAHPSKPAPPSSSRIQQVQVGCVSACFGTTSTGSSAGLGPRDLSELVLALGAGNSTPPTLVTGAVQNTTSQKSSQVQVGTRGAPSQMQGADQANLTIPALGADLIANSTTQAIAQIQIGCLFYCHGTSQSQLASQSNTTAVVAPSAATVSTATSAGVVDVTDQLIWQLQIGCLMWCWDATQDQSASSADKLIGLPAPSPPPPAQPSDPAPPSDPGPSDRAPSDPAAPPGAVGAQLAPVTSTAPRTTESASSPIVGASAQASVRSAIHVGGVVSVASGAWSEKLSATGWNATGTASLAHPASPAPRRPVPAAASTSSFAQQTAISTGSIGAGSSRAAGSFSAVVSSSAGGSFRATGSAHATRRGHASHAAAVKPAGTAAIGGGSVDGGADEAVAIGLAAFAVVALLAGAGAWRRRIG